MARRLTYRAHVIDGRVCWCDPEILQSCPECDDVSDPGCWRCAGRGLVPLFDPDTSAVIVHRAP